MFSTKNVYLIILVVCLRANNLIHVHMHTETAAPPPSTTCANCGTIKKTGQPSCCVRGGDWFKKCGNAGDSKFDHTWNEGIQACTRKRHVAQKFVPQLEFEEAPATIDTFFRVTSSAPALQAIMVVWTLTLGFVLTLY